MAVTRIKVIVLDEHGELEEREAVLEGGVARFDPPINVPAGTRVELTETTHHEPTRFPDATTVDAIHIRPDELPTLEVY